MAEVMAKRDQRTFLLTEYGEQSFIGGSRQVLIAHLCMARHRRSADQ
jgi:hypothetical protein